MTEAEWLACESYTRALSFLKKRVSNRKLRLFACACCRLLGDVLKGEAAYSALAVAEDYADGRTSHDALLAARQAARPTAIDWSDMAGHCARVAVLRATHEQAWQAAHKAASVAREAMSNCKLKGDAYVDAILAVDQGELDLLRDIFNPFRSLALDRAWLTTTCQGLAQAAYDNPILPSGRLEPDRLGILADALEEAGCTDADLLAHLRSPRPHVRGCWPVDLILGKS
jgi:hypothetical protein